MLGVLILASASAAVIDVPGNVGISYSEDTHSLNHIVGTGNSGRLLGKFTVHWQDGNGSFSVPVDTNGCILNADTGGGNGGHVASGPISGSGSFEITHGPHDNNAWNNIYTISGTTANTYTGGTLIKRGLVLLNKTAGIDALPATSVTLGSAGTTARLIWGAHNQIHDGASITVLLPAVSNGYTADANLNYLDLAGFSERIESLTLPDAGTKTQVRTGNGGVLKVKTLTVNGVLMPKGAYVSGTGFVQGTGYIDVDDFGPPVFLEPPALPSTPDPGDATATVHPAALTALNWDDCARATAYDLYLWISTNAKPATPTATLSLSNYSLSANVDSLTTYKWQVVAKNSVGNTAGPEWSFTTVARWDASGYIANPNTWIGGGHAANMTADTTFGWQTGSCSIPVTNNGFNFTLSDGGNGMNYSGNISGAGGFVVEGSGNSTRLTGSVGNTYGGSTLVMGVAQLSKSSGDALRGTITVGKTESTRTGSLLWTAANQINDASVVVLVQTGSLLNLAGFSETFKSLTLGTGTTVQTGAGGVLTVNYLTVNGAAMPLGTYTSTSGFVTGTGSVVVVASPPVDVPADYSGTDIVADLGGGIPGTPFNLLGNATFGSATGTLTGNIDINSAARTLTLETGGNPVVLNGALSGTGNFTVNGGDPPGLQQEDAPFKILPWPKKVILLEGQLNLPSARVVAEAPSLLPLATILASDIQRVYQIALSPVQTTAAAGDIVLRLVTDDPTLTGPDTYRIHVDDRVIVEGATYQAVAFGMMTVLQVLKPDGTALKIARMTVDDTPDRAFRGLQVSIRGGYHPPAWVKKVIDLMRFYKVRVLQLHTTESLWVGAVMDSSNGATAQLLQANSAWSKQEMEDVIDYAIARGVSLVPHNEMRPNDPFWPSALTTNYNTSDAFADYVDEIDGLGAYVIPSDLGEDARFWNFLRVVTQRSYDQFARSWPDGKLPYYHIGPVYGEGGCSGQDAVKMLGFLMEKNPDIKMMYWNGPGSTDPDLSPHKNNIVVDFYSSTWGGTPDSLLAAGYQLCNVSWTPLYIQPGSRVKAVRQGKWIFDEFQLSRFGREGTFGEPIIDHATDCSSAQSGIIGSILPTWDFSGPYQDEGHLEMISPCIPYFAEHIWNIKSWPYLACSWDNASAAYAQLSLLADNFLREARVSSAPGNVTATTGVLPAAVDVFWSESDNYPVSYQVYRATSNNSAAAQPVSGLIAASFVTQVNTFRDLTVTPGQTYYYWVRSINPVGVSAFSQSDSGVTGAGATLPVAAEPFDYPAGTALASLASGTGFGAGWVVDEFNAPLVITTNGLSYPGLLTSGRALHVESTDADESNGRVPPHVRIHRNLASTYGQDGTQVWTSYLIRGLNVEVGEIAANIGGPNVGKGWGDGISVYTAGGGGKMLPDIIYLLVVRYTFHSGNDLIHMWVNPTPGTQPADAAASVITRAFANPTSNILSIRMQPYGKGSYDIDEFRVGRSYDEVVPVAP